MRISKRLDGGSDLAEDPVKVARDRGLTLVTPDRFELFVDIDDKESELHYDAMMGVLRENSFEIEETKRTVSPGGNTHIYLEVCSGPRRTLTPAERVALQACLGSDRKRELLSFLRAFLQLSRPPTVFFEKGGDDAFLPAEDRA